jgi:squalene-hopene/tetraprenyl-beta-curcumene cyclase
MNVDFDKNILDNRLQKLVEHLLSSRTSEGFWKGYLSSSALSTATAVFALGMVDKEKYHAHIQQGLDWLCRNSNDDGSWGDTALSLSNISTTMLCWSAFVMADKSDRYEKVVANTETWLKNHAGSLEPEKLLDAVNNKYGQDRTFSSPILTMCALAGRLNTSEDIWRLIKPLPFELAAVPHKFYKSLRLPPKTTESAYETSEAFNRRENLCHIKKYLPGRRRLSRSNSSDKLCSYGPGCLWQERQHCCKKGD